MNVVLVIAKKPQRASALAERLGLLGVEAIPCAQDGQLVVESLTTHDVSLVLLDVDQSEDSLRFFDTLKGATDVPVVVRGEVGRTEDVVSYLELGAADFVGETTAPPVLAAKIQALLSLKPDRSASATIEVGDVLIDLRNRKVTKGTVEVSLTTLEFRLLRELAASRGRTRSHKDLLRSVWGEDFVNRPLYLRRYVRYLREKLEDDPDRPRVLMTIWGRGYRLVGP